MKVMLRIVALGAVLGMLGGCHFLRGRTGCHADQEYRHAEQLPALKVPAGLDAPNTATALVIPPANAEIPTRGPREACLEEPPKYKPAAPSKPLPQS